MSFFPRLFFLLLLTACSLPAFALEDTLQNREREADRYLATAPLAAMMNDVTNNIAATMPMSEAERALFISVMTKYLDMARYTANMRKAAVKIFTADELKALADFYGSPVGKSAMAKMGAYMGEVMPDIVKEVEQATQKAMQEQAKPK